MSDAPSRPIAGIFWMAVTGVMFVCVTAVVKYIGDDVPAAQSAFLRYVLGLVFLIPMIRPILAARLSKRQVMLFSARGFAHTIAVILWFGKCALFSHQRLHQVSTARWHRPF